MTTRGVAKSEIFLDDLDRGRFIKLVHIVAHERRWRCLAYTLMPNHYHLLVDTTIRELSAGMRVLNGVYAQHFNERHNRVGHLFQGRFDVRAIGDDEYLENACTYIWNNPVRAGLCARASDWPWNGRV